MEVESWVAPSPWSWRNSHVVGGQDSGSVLPRLRGLAGHPTPLGRPQPSSLAELDCAFHHLCRAGGGGPYKRWKKPKEARGEGGVMGRKGKENWKYNLTFKGELSPKLVAGEKPFEKHLVQSPPPPLSQQQVPGPAVAGLVSWLRVGTGGAGGNGGGLGSAAFWAGRARTEPPERWGSRTETSS